MTNLTIQELKEQANSLRKNKKYVEALTFYRQLWENHNHECNEWDRWGYAFCLRKVKKSKEALVICRSVYKTNPEFPQNNNLYAWCIYDTEIKLDEIKNESKFLKAANAILKLTNQEKLSPYAKTVIKVLTHFNNPFRKCANLSKFAKNQNNIYYKNYSYDALEEVLTKINKNDFLIITGSIFLAGELRTHWYKEDYIIKKRKSL